MEKMKLFLEIAESVLVEVQIGCKARSCWGLEGCWLLVDDCGKSARSEK